MPETTDAMNLIVPLWGAIVAFGTVLAGAAGVVVWAYATFEQKEEAKEKQDRAKDNQESLDSRMKLVEGVVYKMGQDVAFIRGVLERERDR